MQDHKWARLLAYITGLVNQRLLLQCEYLAAEDRILRSRFPARLRLSDPIFMCVKNGVLRRESSVCLSRT